MARSLLLHQNTMGISQKRSRPALAAMVSVSSASGTMPWLLISPWAWTAKERNAAR